MKTRSPSSSLRLAFLPAMLALVVVSSAAAGPEPGLTAHAPDHHFALPSESGVALTTEPGHPRVAWRYGIHTGFGKGDSKRPVELLEEGFDPAYGETGSPVLIDGMLLISWSQPTGDVVADYTKITERYYRDAERNAILQDNYLRIDADWHTIALDAETGDMLWRRMQPSASLNFLSSKRDHNGLHAAARDGLYVTVTLLGEVFAYEIATGDLRWSFTIPNWNAIAGAFKQEMLDTRTIPAQTTGPFGMRRSGAIIVDDVAVIPDMQRGLIGLRVTDGNVLWETAAVLHPQATPIPWTHEDKTYLICNNAGRLNRNGIHLLDPADGSILWTFPTNGYNPGQLLVGEDHVLINNDPSRNDEALLECYEVGLDGLTWRWQFEDTPRNRVQVKDDRGGERKGVIRDGVVYLLVGTGRRPEEGYLVSFDLATGAVIHEPDSPRIRSQGMPFIAEDKFFVQNDSAHSGSQAGLMVYQLHGDGQFTYLHNIQYEGFGIQQMTDYLHPWEMPYAGGKVFIRGMRQIAAVDLTVFTSPRAELLLEDAWAGALRPVQAVLFGRENGNLYGGRLESPPRLELGIIPNAFHRVDMWTEFGLAAEIPIGTDVEVDADFHFYSFSWSGSLQMERANGNEWTGTWSRSFAGWEEPVSVSGPLHETSTGGYPLKSWPNPGNTGTPVSFFGPLPEGQERLHLILPEALPRFDGLKDLILAFDHDDTSVLTAVGGAFRYNQAYHEIDARDLVVTPEGLSGTALVIINTDAWIEGDWQNGGSLAGYVTLDLTFGEPDEAGLYPVSGTWSAEWGIEHTRSGPVTAILQNMPAPQAYQGVKIRRSATPGEIALSFFAEAGATYQVETSTTLEVGSWVPVGSPIEGTGEEVDTHHNFTGERRFYRLVKEE
ncbi:MAG: PQQ-binding-like beta-propeller repeat protein [Opitutales bacterium]|nr:PQQ-binding-like beta-propeller repeat protein [Opitutales bacterium]